MANYLKSLSIITAFLVSQFSLAQVPQKMSYQAVIRDVSNNPLVNTTIGMQISILQGSAAGPAVYVETQTPSTNSVGLVTIEIGAGTVVSGSFASIDWSSGLYWLKTETDPTGGTTYSISGANQLLSVPYAFFSGSSSGGGNGWGVTGNSGTIDGVNFIGTTDNVPFTIKVNNEFSGRIDPVLRNSFFGYQSGMTNTTGQDNTATGYASFRDNTTGNFNTAAGRNALAFNTTGSSNTAFGRTALGGNRTGNFNTAVGMLALSSNNTGSNNTAVGELALNTLNSGSNNIGIGVDADVIAPSGASGSTVIGTSAKISGSNSTAIGAFSHVNSLSNNSTAIGAGATVNVSNKIRLGDANVTIIEGEVAYSFPSDARFKYDIRPDVPGLSLITKLKPVTYYLDTKKLENYTKTGVLNENGNGFVNAGLEGSALILRTGFLAQDVEKICNEIQYDFDGIHKPTSDKDHYSLAYSQFIMPLVKGMQEQQEMITKQDEKIQLLQREIEELKQMIRKLK